MILTHPALTKLTFLDYLLTILRSLLRRKQGHDMDPSIKGGWLQGNEREVVLTNTILTAHASCLVMDGALVVGRKAAQQHLRLEHPRSWRVINMLLVDGRLCSPSGTRTLQQMLSTPSWSTCAHMLATSPTIRSCWRTR